MSESQLIDYENGIQLLDDEPSVDDDFGAHHQIANAIERLIRTNGGGKTIALIGDWGSGKSTTINQLKHLINNETKIFTYDAWVHSGDHLRKSFLNELINFLIDNYFLEASQEWEDDKEILAGRLKKSTKSTEPTLTPQGRILVPFVFALPVATVLFNNLIQALIKNHNFSNPYHILVLILTVLTFLAMCVPLVYVAWFSVFRQDKNIFSLIMNKSGLQETTIVKEQPEATTIEFQALFRKVMRASLTDPNKKNNRKIIIVIDNLDRVETEEVKNIWTLLKGFIDKNNYKQDGKDEWINRVWAIIPLAHEETKLDSKVNKGVENLGSKSNKKIKVEGHFLDKVFQVRFHLPPPVYSNWKRHLQGLLDGAFPKESSGQLRIIRTLYEDYLLTQELVNSLPTPRELKLFVNELVVLKVQWQEQFELSIYASYILSFKRSKEDFLLLLRSRQLVSDRVKNILNVDPHRQFAALFFNIQDVNKANAILLLNDVQIMLKDESVEKIKIALEKDSSLIDVLEYLGYTSISLNDYNQPEQFFNSIDKFAGLGKLGKIDNKVYIKKDLQNHLVVQLSNTLLRSFEAYPLFIGSATKAVVSMLSLNADKQLIEAVMTSLKRILTINTSNSSNPSLYIGSSRVSHQRNFVDNLKLLYELDCLQSQFAKLKDKSFKFEVDMKHWLSFCGEDIENGLRRLIYPRLTDQVMLSVVSDAIKNETYDENYLSFLENEMHFLGEESLFSPILNFFKSHLIAVSINKSTPLIIDHLYATRKSKIVKLILTELAQNGVWQQLYYQAYKTGKLSEIGGRCLAMIIIYSSRSFEYLGPKYLESSTDPIVAALFKGKGFPPAVIDDLLYFVDTFDQYKTLVNFLITNQCSPGFSLYVIRNTKNKSKFFNQLNKSSILDSLETLTKGCQNLEKIGLYKEILDQVTENQLPLSQQRILEDFLSKT